jgi:hypothetical protein
VRPIKLDVSAHRIRCRTHDFGCVAFREVVDKVKPKCEFEAEEAGDWSLRSALCSVYVCLNPDFV